MMDLEAIKHWGLLCHSACFVIVGLVLTPRLQNDMTSTHPNLPLLMKMTMIFYIFDVLVILEKKRRASGFKFSMICDSMVYHHVVAFIFCWLFLWYQQGHSHYQFFAWNEIAPTFHMLAYWIPKNYKYRNQYQLFYLSSYCISYVVLIYYLLTCNHDYYYTPNYKVVPLLHFSRYRKITLLACIFHDTTILEFGYSY